MVDPVFVLGSGGREFALALKLYEEGHDVISIPGNDGMERLGIARSFHLPKDMNLDNEGSFHPVLELANKYRPSLIVVGHENQLSSGIVNFLNDNHFLTFGPRREYSIVEASKCWSSEFMKRNRVPTPDFLNPETYGEAIGYLKYSETLPVIKGNGLGSGKNVTVPNTYDEAQAALHEIMVEGKSGGPKVNIQQRVDIDYELSVMAIVDVRKRNNVLSGSYRLLPFSMDHKHLYDDDKGPMTGGMGAVAPIPISDELKTRITTDVIERTIEGFMKEGIEFTGCLYPAIAKDKKGNIWVLEYNMRFGDPEIQVVLRVMGGSLYEYLMAVTTGELDGMSQIGTKGYSMIGNLVSSGLFTEIQGLNYEGQLPNSDLIVVHAGTKASDSGWYTDVENRRRVMGYLSWDDKLPMAIDKVNHGLMKYSSGLHHRNDLGMKALKLFG